MILKIIIICVFQLSFNEHFNALLMFYTFEEFVVDLTDCSLKCTNSTEGNKC